MSVLISVLIPTLNEEKNILEAIESVRSQSLSEFEIIVCDGGSTDRTIDIIESQSYSDIRLLTDTNGLMSQYNTLCKAADGDYLAILDADSKMHPQRLEKQAQILNQEPTVGAVGTGLQFCDQSGNVVRFRDAPTGDEIKWMAIRTNPVYHTTALFRAEAVESVDYYRDQPFGDYDLIARIATDWKIKNIDEVLTTTLERFDHRGRSFSSIERFYYNSLIGFTALKAMDWSLTEFPIAVATRVVSSTKLFYFIFLNI